MLRGMTIVKGVNPLVLIMQDEWKLVNIELLTGDVVGLGFDPSVQRPQELYDRLLAGEILQQQQTPYYLT